MLKPFALCVLFFLIASTNTTLAQIREPDEPPEVLLWECIAIKSSCSDGERVFEGFGLTSHQAYDDLVSNCSADPCPRECEFQYCSVIEGLR